MENNTLLIGDNYKLTRSDDKNLELKVLREKKSTHNSDGGQKWSTVGYYNTVGSAMKRVLDDTVSENLSGDIKDLISVINRSYKKIDDGTRNVVL
jgi:hypothetical protein